MLLALLALLWGGSFFFIELAVEGWRPFTIVLIRVGLAAAVLLGVLRARGEALPRTPKIWGGFALMALLSNVIPFSLITWGQTEIEGGLASILLATTPIFASILAHFFTTDERLTKLRVIGVLMGIVGVTILMGPSFLSGVGSRLLAQGAVLLGAFCYGVVALVGKRMSHVPPLINSTGMLTCATLMMLPLAIWFEQPWTARPGLVPVSAVLLGALFLGERLPLSGIVGMAVILCGLVVIDGRVVKNR